MTSRTIYFAEFSSSRSMYVVWLTQYYIHDDYTVIVEFVEWLILFYNNNNNAFECSKENAMRLFVNSSSNETNQKEWHIQTFLPSPDLRKFRVFLNGIEYTFEYWKILNTTYVTYVCISLECMNHYHCTASYCFKNIGIEMVNSKTCDSYKNIGILVNSLTRGPNIPVGCSTGFNYGLPLWQGFMNNPV